MRGGIQKSKIIGLCAILGVLSFQTAVVAKKKPKRRAARAKATKTVILALPTAFVLRKNVQTISTTTADVQNNKPQMRAPTLSGPPAPQLTATAGQLIISEFRLRGPLSVEDEFIEIYNASGADHTVDGSGTGTGYGIAASDGLLRCTIPDNTVIPNRGHYLCVNSDGYSLASYPGGNNGVMATTASGDTTFNTDIPDNAGIALFSTNVPAEFSPATRLDSVGSTSEANTLYKEGTGYPALTDPSYLAGIDYSFYRDNCGKQGSVAIFGLCPTGGSVVDTDNNAVDFIFVDTNATATAAGPRLGAPGPENRTAPIQRNASMPGFLLDATVADASVPNRQRDTTPDIPNNSTFGTLEIRRRIVNNTGASITRLRFRVVDITTALATGDIADLRARTSLLVVVANINDPATCLASHGIATTPCVVNVQGTTLEESDGPPPPVQQPNGGGFNSSMSAGTVTLATPLANGASINVRFLLGVQKTGRFKFYVNVEVLP